ncbi:MAG: zinc ABC transporter substrate-binding protein [Phycisphaeraceae bacterium]|nr:zinc ABC transporter substrate-binding protein [Phycisphaeraceae bacterium]
MNTTLLSAVRAVCVALLSLPLLAAPGRAMAAPAGERPLRAVVSIAPLKGLVEPLLPAGSTVEMIVPPGVSEHGYEAPPSKLAAMQNADLVVTVGLGLEPQIDKFLAQNRNDKRLALKFADLVGVVIAHEHTSHKHKSDGSCCNHESDPHLWLDPVMVKQFTEKLAARIAERFPDAAGTADEHPALAAAKKQAERIDAIDTAYRAAAENAQVRTIVVGHDAYGWMARRYSLSTIAIAGLTAQEPTHKAVQSAVAAIAKRGARAVFVEPQLSPAAGKRIADQARVPVLTLDPLGDGDWFSMMEQNLESLKKGLGEKQTR